MDATIRCVRGIQAGVDRASVVVVASAKSVDALAVSRVTAVNGTQNAIIAIHWVDIARTGGCIADGRITKIRVDARNRDILASCNSGGAVAAVGRARVVIVTIKRCKDTARISWVTNIRRAKIGGCANGNVLALRRTVHNSTTVSGAIVVVVAIDWGNRAARCRITDCRLARIRFLSD